MKLKDEAAWQKYLEVNTESYGRAICMYAEKWADLMEEDIKNGEEIKDIAKNTSHKADTSGITGCMYGCAVSILFQVWEYGDELRRWHNLDIQIGDEGDKANKTGKVLNPALLNIKY